MKETAVRPRMKFGKTGSEDKVSTRQLAKEAKEMEDQAALMKKIIEDDRKRMEARAISQSKKKSFTIRDSGRHWSRQRVEGKESADQGQRNGFLVKKGIRAYEEVVKNKLKEKKLAHEKHAKQKEIEMEGFLNDIGMTKIEDNIKQAGLSSVEHLRSYDLKKLNLLPGYELKLAKRLAEFKKAQESKQGIHKDTKPKNINPFARQPHLSDDDDDIFMSPKEQKSQPQTKKFQKLVTKHRSLHSESTISDVRGKAECSPPHKQTSSGGTEAPELEKLDVSCWRCLKLISKKKVFVSPLMDGKQFCSRECLQEETKSCTTSCRCGRVVIRGESLCYGGNWFCRQTCADVAKLEEEAAEDEVIAEIKESRQETQNGLETDDHSYSNEPDLDEDLDIDLDFTELI